jgi:hypothetical protein
MIFNWVGVHADTRELFNIVLFIYGCLSYTIRQPWLAGFVEII